MIDTRVRKGLGTIALGGSVVYAGIWVSMALGFVTKVLLARVMSPTDLGVLITGQTLIGLALSVVHFSLPDAVVRFVGMYASQDMAKAKSVLIVSLQLAVLTTAVAALGIGLSANVVANYLYHQATLGNVLVLLAIGMPFTTLTDMLAAGYWGTNQLWVKTLVDIVRPLWVVAAIGLLIALNLNSLFTVALANMTAAIASACLVVGLFLQSHRWRVHGTQQPLSPLLRYSLPLLGSNLLTWPMTAVPLFLGSMVSTQAVAYYSLAMLLAGLIYMPVSAVERAALPVWSEQIAQGLASHLCSAYAFIARWCLIIGSIVSVPLFIYPRQLLTVMYGPGYAEAAPVVQVAAALVLLNAATGPNDSLLRAFGYTREIFVSRLAGGGSILVLAILLIPRWGMLGALISLAVSSVLAIGAYQIFLFLRQGIHPLDVSYLKTLLAIALGVAVTGLARYYQGEGLGWLLTGSLMYVGFLVGLLYLLGAFTLQDRQMLASVCRRIKGLLQTG